MLAGERMPTCPTCGRRFGDRRHGVTFGILAARIIQAVERAGPRGISAIDLVELVYHDRDGDQDALLKRLKGYVYRINEMFSSHDVPIAIRNGGTGNYRISKLRGRQ
jgi:hypothetical protein